MNFLSKVYDYGVNLFNPKPVILKPEDFLIEPSPKYELDHIFKILCISYGNSIDWRFPHFRSNERMMKDFLSLLFEINYDNDYYQDRRWVKVLDKVCRLDVETRYMFPSFSKRSFLSVTRGFHCLVIFFSLGNFCSETLEDAIIKFRNYDNYTIRPVLIIFIKDNCVWDEEELGVTVNQLNEKHQYVYHFFSSIEKSENILGPFHFVLEKILTLSGLVGGSLTKAAKN